MVIQEIKSSVKDLEILLWLLGDDWAYVINDITEGSAGNSRAERLPLQQDPELTRVVRMEEKISNKSNSAELFTLGILLSVIGLTAFDGVGAVELFEEDDEGEFVLQSERGESVFPLGRESGRFVWSRVKR